MISLYLTQQMLGAVQVLGRKVIDAPYSLHNIMITGVYIKHSDHPLLYLGYLGFSRNNVRWHLKKSPLFDALSF